MILSDLTEKELAARFHGRGLVISSGPFRFRIKTHIEAVQRGIKLLYTDYPVPDEGEFIDFTVTLRQSGGIRRWWHPQVNFDFGGMAPFLPLPLDHAYPLLEWGMNWCISSQVQYCLNIHAAVIERNGFALIMPAPPGTGKSTLCAALVTHGWRLLSDELTMISLNDRMVMPLVRPISLKGKSIEILQAFSPNAVFNEPTRNTIKGTVTHMKVPRDHIDRCHERVPPRWIVFPKYVPNSMPVLTPKSRADSLIELGRNAFNYMVLGLTGFETLVQVVSRCSCYDFQYSQLDDAISIFDDLANTER
jgi:HprK-related kinase A